MARHLGALLLLGMTCGIFACGDDGTAAPVDPPDALGTNAVGHLAYRATDPQRDGRTLLLDVWYPAPPAATPDAERTRYPLAAGIGLESAVAFDAPAGAPGSRLPLLVFSHGFGGINTQSVELMEALASHGFVVVAPEHTGNAQSSLTDSFDEAAAHRVPDVTFVIDSFLARDRTAGDPFHERIDASRIGVLGHSFGGMTAIGCAAGWAGAPPDPRVVAIAPISAVIDGDLQRDDRESPNAGFTAEQLAGVGVPVLLMGGTADVDVPIENNEIAFAQLTASPRVVKVDIVGATHTHFANVCAIGNLLIDAGIGPQSWPALGAAALVEPYEMSCTEGAFPIEEAIRLQNLYVVSFFRRHLLGERGYDRFLSADYAAAEPAILFAAR